MVDFTDGLLLPPPITHTRQKYTEVLSTSLLAHGTDLLFVDRSTRRFAQLWGQFGGQYSP